ncbi:MAG: DUF402 domain-containing protein [Anaerolineae bacterium]|nr:DUF402 domain-containing protein [Anaerolineae bacterium]
MPGNTMWRIEARKYDQRLHYTFPAVLVDDDGNLLQLKGEAGGIIDHRTRGRSWAFEAPFDMFAWRGRWYNIYVNRNADHTLSHFYCNVALPLVITGQTLVFVDLDLDLRIWPDGRIEVLDEDEFAEHTVLFGYPDDVQRTARQALDDILALWEQRCPPFDRV